MFQNSTNNLKNYQNYFPGLKKTISSIAYICASLPSRERERERNLIYEKRFLIYKMQHACNLTHYNILTVRNFYTASNI